MKKITIYVFLTFMFFSFDIFAQNGPGPHYGSKRMQQLRQLEQLKLIELLNLDEDTSARFFARRKAHLDKVQALQKEKNEIINELAVKLKAGEKVDSKKYRERLEKIEKRLFEERREFYNSLDDILTNEQIAKFIVFQSRFRKEIMRKMMKNRKGGMKNGME